MTQAQQEDLLIEWNLYGNTQQREIMKEYLELVNGRFSQQQFMSYLREKLEMDGYWKKAGLL